MFCGPCNAVLTAFSLSKPSRPSRAYLHLTDQIHLSPFNEKVRHTNFNDAKNTTRDSTLIGQPCLELAPFPRVPIGRRRIDARQSTIDQDPDFQEFLESLTNPITKPHAVDGDVPKQEEKVTTTPLIEYLREKKAAKDKPAPKAASKHGRHEAKEARAAEKKAAKGAKEAPLAPEKSKRPTKADRAAKEAVKALNREVASAAAQKQSADGNANAVGAPSTQRRRERPPVSVAAKIQRDLGLSPAAGGRRNAKPAADDANQPPPDATQSKDSSATPPASIAPPTGPSTKSSLPNRGPRPARERRSSKSAVVEKTNAESNPDGGSIPTGPAQAAVAKKPPMQQQPPKGPAANRQQPPQGPKAATAQTASEPATSTSSAAAQAPSAPRQAFLKHANASQGITEPLLHEALSPFGAIEHLEIDKRKGFAYVDFEEPEGLKKAIAASPVKVAQGAVQVLERRDRPSNPPRPPMPPVSPIQHHGPPRGGFRGRGGPRGRGGGRGGRVGTPPKVDVAQPAAPSGGAGT